MWTNPSQKSRQGSDPPHSGNACILGESGPVTPPLAALTWFIMMVDSWTAEAHLLLLYSCYIKM